MDADRRRLLQLLTATCAICPFAAAGILRAKDTDGAVPAEFWSEAGEWKVTCTLCPRKCTVADLERGTCGVRENRGGKYYTLVHSSVCAMNNDPIEKKPLFHFRPGSMAFSIATAGCNMECRFCQNWEISQFRPEQVTSRRLTPAEVVAGAGQAGSRAIAFTYSEPVVAWEYVRDVCAAAQDTGIGRVMISNGYIQKDPMRKLLPLLDAVKIDFKAFSESFYRDVCSARLRPVLDTLRTIRASGVWLEIVVLLIPTLNDDPGEIRAMCRWIVQELGPSVPVHFTRFHPSYKLVNLPPTPVNTLEVARQIAKEQGVRYAYAGNVPGHPAEDTTCHACGHTLIKRYGFQIRFNRMRDGTCPSCGERVAGVWR